MLSHLTLCLLFLRGFLYIAGKSLKEIQDEEELARKSEQRQQQQQQQQTQQPPDHTGGFSLRFTPVLMLSLIIKRVLVGTKTAAAGVNRWAHANALRAPNLLLQNHTTKQLGIPSAYVSMPDRCANPRKSSALQSQEWATQLCGRHKCYLDDAARCFWV